MGCKPCPRRPGLLGEEDAFPAHSSDRGTSDALFRGVEPFPLSRTITRVHALDSFDDDVVFELAHRRGRGRRLVELHLESAFPNGAPWAEMEHVPLHRRWTVHLGLFVFVGVAMAWYAFVSGDGTFRDIVNRAYDATGLLRGGGVAPFGSK